MIIIGFANYPQQSAKEAVNRMMKVPRLPDYIKSRGFYGYTTEKGVESIAIYEFESSKADEALEQITNAYWQFHDVPGHNFHLVPCSKARDAAQRFLELF